MRYGFKFENVRRVHDLTVFYLIRGHVAEFKAALKDAGVTGWSIVILSNLPASLRDPRVPIYQNNCKLSYYLTYAFVSHYDLVDIQRIFNDWLGGPDDYGPYGEYRKHIWQMEVEYDYKQKIDMYDPVPYDFSRTLYGKELFDEYGYRMNTEKPKPFPWAVPFNARRVKQPTVFLFPTAHRDAIERFMELTACGGWVIANHEAIHRRFPNIQGLNETKCGIISYYDPNDITVIYKTWINGGMYENYQKEQQETAAWEKEMIERWKLDPAPIPEQKNTI